MSDWTFDEDFQPPVKRGRGRPKGVRNKTPVQKAMICKIEKLYERVAHMFTAEQRQYYEKAFAGQMAFDPLKEAELFMRLFSIYVTEVMTEGIENKEVSQDVAQLVAQYRMGLKDISDMQLKREDMKAKHGNNNGVVDPTRQSSESHLDEIIRRASQGKA
jgi:hypothetical protein